MICRQPFLAVLLMASAACASSLKVGYDYDRGISFTAYHTYDWLSDEQEKTGDRRADNSAMYMRIRAAVGGNYSRKAIGGSMTRSRISM